MNIMTQSGLHTKMIHLRFNSLDFTTSPFHFHSSINHPHGDGCSALGSSLVAEIDMIVELNDENLVENWKVLIIRDHDVLVQRIALEYE